MLPALLHEKQKRVGAVMEHASGDKRFKILEAHMKKHQYRHDALIEILHKAQELFGYLEDDLLLFVAHTGLNCPPAASMGLVVSAEMKPPRRKERHVWTELAKFSESICQLSLLFIL